MLKIFDRDFPPNNDPPSPSTSPPRQQETVAFGDVTVEDSRNLTVNNSRKILRLAQCQV